MHKKHKLTPEERKELRKQKKIERKLRLAEKKKQIKRDHLEREVKYGQLTIKRYEKDWRAMLIKVTLPRMRQELEFAWHNFERVLDCKDFTISLILDEIKDAEEQYMQNFRTHLENTDKLLQLFYDRLDELKKDFELGVKQLEDKCNEEIKDMKDMSNENSEYLRTMLYQLELAKRDQARTKRAEYYSRLDEVEVKNQLVLQKLKANLESKYQNIFDGMKQFIRNYNKQIKDRKKEHNILKDQDDAMQKLIAQQFKHIKKFYDIIRQLRHNYNDMKQNEGSKLLDLQAERQYFSYSFLSLKKKLENDKRDDFNKLARLSESCAKAFDYLENLNKKGELILKMAAVCRKLETQKEKILPFPLNTTGIVAQNDKNIDDEDEMNGVRKELELFWQRVGQAYAVHYNLKRETQFLKDENQLFVLTHNEYCEKLEYPSIHNFRSKMTNAKIVVLNYEKFQERKD